MIGLAAAVLAALVDANGQRGNRAGNQADAGIDR